jgi:hypothetical protein
LWSEIRSIRLFGGCCNPSSFGLASGSQASSSSARYRSELKPKLNWLQIY